MTTLEQLEERVRDLERRRHVLGAKSVGGVYLASKTVKCEDVQLDSDSDSCLVIRVDKDGDGDFDPRTSTSWDGDSFSDAASGTINWNTAFGVPSGAKMVFLDVDVRDAASAGGSYWLGLKAKSSTTNWSLVAQADTAFNDQQRHTFGWVPVQSNGTSYYYVNASGTNTMDISMYVVAYAR